MKYYLIGILLVLSILISCKEEKENLPPSAVDRTFGAIITATMNGQPWPLNESRPGWTHYGGSDLSPHLEGIHTFCTNKTLQITMGTNNQQGFHREDLSFLSIPPKIGKYDLVGMFASTCQDTVAESSMGVYGSDGDVVVGVFDLLPKEENYIEITSLDLEKRVVKGYFQSSYVSIRPGAHPSTYSDTLHFKGTFDVRISPDKKPK